MAATTTSSVEETLAWEAEYRQRAGAAALIAGIFTLAGGLLAAAIYKDFPRVPLVDALRDAFGQPLPGRRGLKTEQVLFYDDKALQLIVVSVILAIGALAMGAALAYLFRATKARRPEMPNIALISAVAGPVALAVSELLLQIVVSKLAHDFASGSDRSSAAAHDALQSSLLVASQILRQLAIIALGVAFVMIAINAMRVGLLTRFMGILGVIVGVLFVIPIGSQLPIVQCFWLVAVGLLILGRTPSGVPPAWETGRAEPWPSQQELREARERAEAPPGPAPVPAASGDEAVEKAPDGVPHPASKKRKRKRR
jgi:MFS family permease